MKPNKVLKRPQLTFIDLCCGGGGASLGISQAGLDGVLGIDFAQKAVECHIANFPQTLVLEKRMEQVSAEEIFRLTGLEKGQLDLLHCSWPCQLYSQANAKFCKKPPEDINRNFNHFVDKIKDLQPRSFTGENVDGVVTGAKKPYYNEMIKKLNELGNYDFKFKLVTAPYYGVYQDRRRLFLIGKRRDVNPGVEIQFPEPNIEGARLLRLKHAIPEAKFFRPGQFKAKAKSSNHYMCTITASNQTELFIDGKWELLSVDHAKLLMGFPADFRMVSKSRSVNMRILGNAVCPPVMRKIAETIKQTILK